MQKGIASQPPLPRAIVAAAAVLLAACLPRPERPLVFAVGGVPAEVAVWERVVADFTAATGHPVEILRQPADSDQRRQGLLVSLRARQPDPDVFLMDVAWIGLFAASGWLAPLDSLVRPGMQFAGRADSAGMRGGARYALPVYVDGGLLYYRKDLLAEYGYPGPPETWKDLIAMSRKAQDAHARVRPYFHGYLWQGAQYEGLICSFLEVAASAGGGIRLEDGRYRVDSEANVRALSLMRDLIHRHAVSPRSTYTEMREEQVREAFQRGDALFERNWPYAWALHQAEGSPVRGKVGIAPLPHFQGHSGASTLGGWHVGVSASADRRAEAMALAAFLVSVPVQRRLALELGWNPGRRELYGDPILLAKSPHLADLAKVLDRARARPNVPYYARLSQALQRHLNDALSRRADPAEALERADRELAALAKRYGTR